jgi:general secretion pathway protein A
MYDGFYNLKRKPFQLNTDPDFFFHSGIHKRAIAYMRYGLIQGEGFVVITGMPGLGKTILVKELVKTLHNKDIIIAVMVSSQVGAVDTLRMISTKFGLPANNGDDKASLISGIEQFIKTTADSGKRILLIVDEAQNLPKQSLEELRMLSNFEMQGKIVFQTFLIGQKQLRNTIFSPDMEQFKQRIVSTFQLEPLNAEETKQYILFRLEKVGWDHSPEFDDEVFDKIHQFTDGIPRRINTLCDRVLLYGYLAEQGVINLESVEKVIAEMEEEMVAEKGMVIEEDSSVLLGNEMTDSLEYRLLGLERKVMALQVSHNKERSLLRKAISMLLDMKSVE